MSYQRDLWKEIKTEYLKRVEEALNTAGQTDNREMLEDLDVHLERKYMDLTLEEKCLERFEKIIAQMGPASDYAELLKRGEDVLKKQKTAAAREETKIKSQDAPAGADEEKPAETTVKPVFIPIEPYDEQGVLSKAKWLAFAVLAAAIVILIWKYQYNAPAKREPAVQPRIVQTPSPAPAKQNVENTAAKKNTDLEYQTYIVRFTTASEVNAISASQLLAMFTAKEPPQVKAHHFKTEVKPNMLVGLICVDNKSDLDATTGMLLGSNDLKLLSIEPGTEENLKNLYAMGQPSLTAKPPSPPVPAAASAPSMPVAENKNTAAQAETLTATTENTNKANIKKIISKPSGPAAVLIAKPGIDNIAVGKTNARFVKSIFGAPSRTDMNGRMLRYTSDGIDFLFSPDGRLSEIHLNGSFEGRLDTGISINSTQTDVFTAYGTPVQTMKAVDLRRRNNERVLWVKGNTSRIYYGKWGLIFWFENESVSQVIVFQGRMQNTGKEFAADAGPAIQSWTENGKTVDRIDYPFISDPEAIGSWRSVDFVKNIEDFEPGYKSWNGELYLKGMVINQDGTTLGPWRWTKGIIVHPGDRTASRYIIKDFDGTKYMFFEWKNGDYTIRHEKPWFYVLRKAD
jgi:hypothetical protein